MGTWLETARVSLFCQLPVPEDGSVPDPVTRLSFMDAQGPPPAWHPGRVMRCFASGCTRLKLGAEGASVKVRSDELGRMAADGRVALLRLPKPKTPRAPRPESTPDGEAAAGPQMA